MSDDLRTLSVDTRAAIRPSGRALGARIMCHPDLRRVSELALLFDAEQPGKVELSRGTPSFRDGTGEERGPLATLHVSRRPLSIERDADLGCRLSAPAHVRVSVDGQALDGARSLSRQQLQAGVSITLGRAVALWLGEVEVGTAPQLDALHGVSAVAAALKRKLAQLGPLHAPVLLLGPSGSGKHTVASVLHRLAGHRPEQLRWLLRGAAPRVQSSEGACATMCIDELSELSAPQRAELVRMMDEAELAQRAGMAAPRVIAVSTQSLPELQRRSSRDGLIGRFTHVVPMPTLDERREDVAELFVSFLRDALVRFGAEARLAPALDTAQPFLPAALMLAVVRSAWPGQLRQLRNFAETLALASHELAQIEPAAWLPLLSPPPEQRSDPAAIDDDAIRAALAACDYNVSRAARQLHVSKSWLHPRLARSKLLPRARDLSAESIERALLASSGVAEAAAALRVSRHGLLLRMRSLGIEAPTRPGSATPLK
jgi:two-component system nitrogen regulation response regulator GlnG